ncbi:MAG: CPBP family intramembrane metalloprotease, partial [Planctomycetales bacterium]|nr:CPBP family intramembrane metalloprotease [Planctomycetales bacterium]
MSSPSEQSPDEPIVDAEIVASDEQREPSPSKAGDERRFGHPIVAWVVTGATIGLLLYLSAVAEMPEETDSMLTERWQAQVMEWQGKYLVSASQFPTLTGEQLFEQAESLDMGTIDNRLRFVILAGELAGAEKGAAHLEDLRRRLRISETLPTETQAALMSTLKRMYGDYESDAFDAPSVTEAERQQLISQLGWYGRLALYPSDTDDEAEREQVLSEAAGTVPLVIGAILFLFGVGALAFVGCVLFVVLTMTHRLTSRLTPTPRYGGVYMEAFAAWMVLHIVAGVAVSVVGASRMEWQISLIALSLFVSGAAIFWPRLRGVSWRTVREEIGIGLGGRSLVRELALGIFAWVSTLPLMFLALLFTAALGLGAGESETVDPFAPQKAPTHPIVEWVLNAGTFEKVLIVVIACLLAPVFEEIMFRGFLYRHLRENTVGWRLSKSIAFSAGLSSVIFAVIHPQG